MKHHYEYKDMTVKDFESVPFDNIAWSDFIAEYDYYDITDAYAEHAAIDLEYLGSRTYGEHYAYTDDDGVPHIVIVRENFFG